MMSEAEELKQFGCVVRVPDNGDCYRCGHEVYIGKFCKQHAQRRLSEIADELEEHRHIIKSLLAERQLLSSKQKTKRTTTS